MFSFFKNDSPPYSVESIGEGRLLNKAEEVDVNFFFKHWMKKRPRKAAVGSWFILHQDENFIYWGRPVFKRLFSDKRNVDAFYKTNRKALQKQFPEYKKRTGNSIRLKLCEHIRKELDKDMRLTLGLGFKAKLLETTIEVEAPCSISTVSDPNNTPSSEQAIYFVVLDKSTLDLIELNRIK